MVLVPRLMVGLVQDEGEGWGMLNAILQAFMSALEMVAIGDVTA